MHDQDGAAAAAANLSTRLASAIGMGMRRVDRVAGQIGTQVYSERIRQAYGAGERRLPPGSVFRTIPISYRVLTYSPTLASVRVWSASFLAAPEVNPGGASFKTATIVVRWRSGGWRVEDVRDATPGPTPVTGTPSSGAEFVTSLEGMEGFRVLP